VLLAKTTEPNPRLPGTLATRGRAVVAAGGQALPVQTDIRDEAAVAAAVQAAVERFGGIDILVNNASAISLTPTPATPMKRFDLMFGVNVRGTYCLHPGLPARADEERQGRPQPARAEHEPAAEHEGALVPRPCGLHHGQVRHERVHAGPRGRVPPAGHCRQQPVAAHRHRHRGAADDPGRGPGNLCRKPEILADAAWFILTSDAKATTGHFFIDDELLARSTA
jgi:citronellol/citronellal dehydrogenase